ncbi:MAG TPA: hypothetical protein VNL16_10940 [Chloroflexota bacterium]|nr:hypothetical protein [Chloroflexota bacterium]
MHGEQFRQVFLDKLAPMLGVDEAKLKLSFKEAAKETVDKLQHDGYLTQAQADRMKMRIETGKRNFFGGSIAMLTRFHQGLQAVFEAIAAKLGTSVQDLEAQLDTGKSLDEIGKEKGVTNEELRQTVAKTIKPRLQEAVKEGKIAPKMAEAMIHRIEQPEKVPTAA